MKALIAAGALVNPPDDGGFSPLHWSAGLNHDGEGVKILLAGGAVVNQKRAEDGVAPLHIAKTKGAIDSLLDGNADIEVRDNQGWTHRRA